MQAVHPGFPPPSPTQLPLTKYQNHIGDGVGSTKDSLIFEQQGPRKEPSCMEDSDGREAPERTTAARGKGNQSLPEIMPLVSSNLEVEK